MSEKCHCGSTQPFAECCSPCLEGSRVPATAEELLRSRYSAFVVGNLDYIRDTLHPDQRKDYDEKGARDWSLNSEWLGFEIYSKEGGAADDTEGTIDFVARYRQNGVPQEHRELAEFKKQEERWFFWDASFVKPETVRREQPKVGRNDPCPCGSGKKYKKCCER